MKNVNYFIDRLNYGHSQAKKKLKLTSRYIKSITFATWKNQLKETLFTKNI